MLEAYAIISYQSGHHIEERNLKLGLYALTTQMGQTLKTVTNIILEQPKSITTKRFTPILILLLI